ncbi:MAG: hypothetical protein R6X17_04405 [Candidatus Competibacteraceae bacterium]
MADRKTATLMLRIQPTIKQKLRELAAREHRSLSNMIEVLILDYGRRRGPESLENLPDGGRFKGTA